MSIKVMNRVWETSQHGGTELLLLIALSDWADDWGYCHPSVDQMAVKIRQSKRNVLRLLEKLEVDGELRQIKRASGGRGHKAGSVYQVLSGMSSKEIAESEQLSPLAKEALKTMTGVSQFPKTSDKLSPVYKETGDKSGPEMSPVSSSALNVLINVSDIKDSYSLSDAPEKISIGQETDNAPTYLDAEALYRKVRPNHITLPRSDKFEAAMGILAHYLRLHKGDVNAAAEALRPFAEEADRRGISPLNLCWLSEWAAAGQIPPPPRKQSRKGGNGHWIEPLPPAPEPEANPERDELWQLYDVLLERVEQTIGIDGIRKRELNEKLIDMYLSLFGEDELAKRYKYLDAIVCGGANKCQ
ncbi:MAG: hypothetical protein ANABAC_1322 [Anaerolineae bacterium]|nr:MAG: hypothetical protein ANABAC_1322 [Anaerolineae bacterium]